MNKKQLAIVAFLIVCLAASIQTTTASTHTFYGPEVANPGLEGGGIGILYDTNVTVTYMSNLGLVYRNIWGSNSTTAFNETISTGANYKSITWNYSSAQNYTGLIDFFPTETKSYYILYVADPNVPTALYTINIVDYAGMANPYLEIGVPIGTMTPPDPSYTSYSDVVARHYLNSSSTVPFALNQYYTYRLSVICDQGTYSQDFTTGNEYTINIPILTGMFPVTNTSTAEFTASRINATTVGVAYSDPSNTTNWLSLAITHKSGTTTINDYSSNTTGSSQTIVWTDADSDKSYQVDATANIAGTNYTWTIQTPKEPASNPFDGVFDFLGTNTATLPFYYTGWPAGMTSSQIAQLIAAFIITCFLGIGSFRNAGASMIAACCIGGIMFAMGWWNGGLTVSAASAIPEFALAFFVAVLTHFNEKKSEGQGLS